MEKKMTKKEMFGMLLEVEGVGKNEALVAFINHEIELLNKKYNSTSLTKTQKANEKLIERVYEALEVVDKPVTITELQKEVEEMASYSNQKLSALLKKLVDSKRVAKTTNNKKSYFSVVGV